MKDKIYIYIYIIIIYIYIPWAPETYIFRGVYNKQPRFFSRWPKLKPCIFPWLCANMPRQQSRRRFRQFQREFPRFRRFQVTWMNLWCCEKSLWYYDGREVMGWGDWGLLYPSGSRYVRLERYFHVFPMTWGWDWSTINPTRSGGVWILRVMIKFQMWIWERC